LVLELGLLGEHKQTGARVRADQAVVALHLTKEASSINQVLNQMDMQAVREQRQVQAMEDPNNPDPAGKEQIHPLEQQVRAQTLPMVQLKELGKRQEKRH
jgi:hypothetical protein